MKYWAVGASQSGQDLSNDFIEKGIWYDGYQDDTYKKQLESVNIGDILLLKSSSTKGTGHSISFTKLKGIGKVISKVNCYQFNVEWFKIEKLPLDFDGLYYSRTIEKVRDDELMKFTHDQIKIERDKMDSKLNIDLLKYKYQIILQGPPGTGKTRLAELIAKELTKPRTIGNPESIIDNFVKDFDPNDEAIKSARKIREECLCKFYEFFPKEDIDKLTLESYCVGRGDRDNFCWWIETGLKALGYYSPGNAKSYLIFWKK